MSSIIVTALRDLGVDARIGEIPGEYCPGEHSVNASGKRKLMGVGQRILLHAAHVGGVVVVGQSDRVRDVLIPVYEALDLEWDPATAGSVEDEVPGIEWDGAGEAILRRFADSYEMVEESLRPEILDRAHDLQAMHEVRVGPDLFK